MAPGATPGQFAQVGGISYSFDASKQAQTLDVNGNVTREGQRIVNAAIIDENGRVLDTLVQNGQLVGDANRAIKVVTLDFLATGTASAPGPSAATASARIRSTTASMRAACAR